MSWRWPPAAWVIVGLLTASFAFCIFVPLLAWADIPDLFSDSVKSAFDTFVTPLGGAIGFIFSTKKSKSKRPGSKLKAASAGSAYTPVEIFAILLVSFYCGVFDILMLQFSLHRMNIVAVIAATSQLRPYVAFLITAVVAYYFGTNRATNE